MGDPLSVAAGVAGIVTAAVQVSKLLSDFIRRTKDAPKQATFVLTEIGDVHNIIAQLHPFLLGLETQDSSRTSLIQVDSVIAILTGCVSTFSELEEVVDQLKAQDLGFLDRTKWVSKDSVLAGLIARLQAHKLSLSLMLDILNGTTMREVKTSVDRLNISMRDNYQAILETLRSLEKGHISHSRRTSRAPSSRPVSQTILRRNSVTDSVGGKRLSRNSFILPFEKDLAVSRVYKKICFWASTLSLLTTEEPHSSWSTISGLSAADIASSISVLNLAITSAQLYNAAQYDANENDAFAVSTRDNGSRKTTTDLSEIDSRAVTDHPDDNENSRRDWIMKIPGKQTAGAPCFVKHSLCGDEFDHQVFRVITTDGQSRTISIMRPLPLRHHRMNSEESPKGW